MKELCWEQILKKNKFTSCKNYKLNGENTCRLHLKKENENEYDYIVLINIFTIIFTIIFTFSYIFLIINNVTVDENVLIISDRVSKEIWLSKSLIPQKSFYTDPCLSKL